MDHFGGMDVSVKETNVCILDDTGKIVKEVKVASEPQALLKVLENPTYCFKRIGLEAGPFALAVQRSRPKPRPLFLLGKFQAEPRVRVTGSCRLCLSAAAVRDRVGLGSSATPHSTCHRYTGSRPG